MKVDVKSTLNCLKYRFVWEGYDKFSNLQLIKINNAREIHFKILRCSPYNFSFSLHFPLVEFTIIAPDFTLEFSRATNQALAESASKSVFIREYMPAFNEFIRLEISILHLAINILLKTSALPDRWICRKYFAFISWNTLCLNFFKIKAF